MRISSFIAQPRWACFLVILTAIGCEESGSNQLPNRDINGFADLHVAARAVDMDRVRDLLLYGADPNVMDLNGVTPLHRAARDGHQELVTELVRFSADMDLKTSTGWTALHLAIRSGDPEMVDLLLGYGASAHVPLSENKTPLIYAVEREETRIAETLIVMGGIDATAEGTQNINATDAHGNSALTVAVQKGNSGLAVSLLFNGADANIRTKTQDTPLHIAIRNDDLVAAGVLLERGARLMAKGPGGTNALVAAQNHGNAEMIDLLASYLPNADSEF
jgi:ankyrin